MLMEEQQLKNIVKLNCKRHKNKKKNKNFHELLFKTNRKHK